MTEMTHDSPHPHGPQPMAPFAAAQKTAGLIVAIVLLGAAGYAAAQEDPPAGRALGAETAYASAAALQDQGLFDLAADEWRTLAENFPDDRLAAQARYNLGVCLFQQSNFTAAADAFSSVADPKRRPEIAESALANLGLARFNAARTEPSQERYRAALAAFDRLLESFPEGDQAATAKLYRGETLLALGEPQAAADSLQRLLDNHPDSPVCGQARLGLGSALQQLGRLEPADAVLSELIDKPGDAATVAEAHRQRGEVRLAAGRFAEAAVDFGAAAAAKLPGADAAKQQQAFCLYQAGDATAAAEKYDELIAAWPKSPLAAAARLSAAKCLIATGNDRAAAERLATLWSSNQTGGNAEAAHWLARSLLAVNKPTEAAAVVDAALRTGAASPWLEELQMDRADLLYQTAGRQAEAVDAYADLAGRLPNRPIGQRAACLAAQTAIEVGDNQRAASLAEEALARGVADEFRVELLQAAAESRQRVGDADAAVRWFRQLAAKQPDDPRRADWLLRIAEGLIASDRAAEAAALLGAERSTFTGDNAAAALLIQADALRRTDQPQPAIDALSRLIDEHQDSPAHARALYERGQLRTRLALSDAANADFRRLLAESPTHRLAPYARLALASNQFATGDAAECAASLQPLVAGGEGPVGEANFLLASAQQELGDFAAALESLKSAVAPPAERLYLRGVCQSRLGRVPAAIATLETCLTADGAAAVADRTLYELAWLQHGADRQAKADALFAQLADEHPASPLAAESHYRLGQSAYDERRFDAAAERLQKAASGATEDQELAEQARHLLGWVRFDQGEHAAAAEAFAAQRQATPNGPLAADARLMIAECRFAQQQFADALEAYRAALGDDAVRDDLKLLGLLHAGQAAGQRNDWEAALPLLRQASTLAAGSSHADQIAYELAWTLHKLGRGDEALSRLSRLAESDAGVLSARARFVVGELQFAAMQHDEAVRTFFRVAYGYGGVDAPYEYHEWQSQALFEAARCLEVLGRLDPARKLYAELLERFPDSEQASHARQRLQSITQQ